MRTVLAIIFIIFTSLTNAALAKSEEFFIAIQLDMQMGTGIYLDDSARRLRSNNTERVKQYMYGKKFDTLRECEMYMLDSQRTSVMEYYSDNKGMGFVWNNYASDNKTIVQQWRCLEIFVIDD